jgi:hypothetical protein
MKIIDGAGRLFGKINIIDFLVLTLVFCLLPMFYFGYKIYTKKPIAVVVPKKNLANIETDCLLVQLDPQVLKMISVGDKEINGGQIIGEIISLGKSGPQKYEFDLGGTTITKFDNILKQCEARLKLSCEIKGNELFYKDKPIRLSAPFNFQSNNYNVLAMPFGREETKVIDLYITLKNLDEETAKKISIGDKDLDAYGKINAEILNVGKIETNSFEVDLGRNNFVVGEDVSKKQVSTKMRLYCKVLGNSQLYYKDTRIESLSPIQFNTTNYSAIGIIAKTYNVERWMLAKVKFSGIFPEISQILQKGDVEKDNLSNIEARIISILENKPSQVLVIKETDFIQVAHPFQRDITALIEVKCYEKEGTYFFKNYPIKMGNSFVFSTDLYSISGIIIGVEMK